MSQFRSKFYYGDLLAGLSDKLPELEKNDSTGQNLIKIKFKEEFCSIDWNNLIIDHDNPKLAFQ